MFYGAIRIHKVEQHSNIKLCVKLGNNDNEIKKYYEQLIEIMLGHQHKHLEGLNAFQKAEKMWKMSLATDKYK
jgi:hypothetical protein